MKIEDLYDSSDYIIMTWPSAGRSILWTSLQEVYMLTIFGDCNLSITEKANICQSHMAT